MQTTHGELRSKAPVSLRTEPGSRGSARRPVAAFVVVTAPLILIAIGSWWPPVSVFLAASLVPLGIAAWIDARQHRLPDPLVVLALVPVSIAVVAAPVEGVPAMLGSVLAGAVLVALPLLVLHLVWPASMGFGDVKAGVALGAGLGLIDWRLGMGALCVASALSASWGIARRRRSVPFGPGLVAGAVVVLVLARLAGIGVLQWQ